MAIYSLRMTAVGKTTQRQPFTAAAHLKYITRPKAVTHVMAARMPVVRRQAVAWLKQQEREDRKNARVIDKLVLALPQELPRVHQHALVKAFAEEITRGRASWFAAFHTGGKDRNNPHCHLILRDRDVETGRRVMYLSAGVKEAAERKAKGQSAPTNLKAVRELWERCANAALEVAGRPERVDRRSLKDQGVDRPAQVHEGPNVRAMHHRGVRPVSKDRVVPAKRGRGRKGATTRVIRYAAIDGGVTRAEYNDAIRASERKDAPRAADSRRSQSSTRRETPMAVEGQATSVARSRDVLRPDALSKATGTKAIQPPSRTEQPIIRIEPPPLTLVNLLTGSEWLPDPLIQEPDRLPDAPALVSVAAMAKVNDDQKSVDDARDAYHTAFKRLRDACGAIFVEPRDAADELFARAEDLAAAEAIDTLRNDPERFGDLRADVAEPLSASLVDSVTEALGDVVDAQDALDLATAKREAAKSARSADAMQIVNFGGREFYLDTGKGELRSVDNEHERYAAPELAAEARDIAAGPSLAESLQRDVPVMPVPPREPGRGPRSR